MEKDIDTLPDKPKGDIDALPDKSKKDIDTLPELICEEYSLKHNDPSLLSPLTMAFIGDTVFDLIVRTRVIECGNAPVRKLHHTASSLVNAGTQAAIAKEIMPLFTEEEMHIFKRGRNAKSYTAAKNADITDYRIATGLEALLGWLYLNGRMPRIYELILPVLPEHEVRRV